MYRIFGIIFLLCGVFSSGCFSSGKDAASRLRTQKACRCAAMDHHAWQQRDRGLTPRYGGNITMRLESEPGQLLSMYSAHPAIIQMIDHDVLEALINLNPYTGEIAPELARYWEIDKQRTSIVFYLNESARWQDGEPFTADDVVYTFKQLLDPAGGAIYRSKFEDIANVEALTRYSVLFELDHPRAGFLADVSRVMILPEHLLKNTTVISNEYARDPIGTGPFKLREWESGQFITLERNSEWRGKAPYPDEIIYRVIPENRVAMDLFTAGTLDILTDTTDAAPKGAVVVDFPQHLLNAWVFNTHTPFFADAKTRRAISRLIDRQAIACSIMKCLADPVYSPWPDMHIDTSSLTFSPKDARKLLIAAGWEDANRDGILDRQGVPFKFSLLVPDTDMTGHRAVAVIVHDLRKVGIEVNTTIVSWAVYTDRLRSHRFDASILAVSIARPFDAAELFQSDGIESGRNFGGFKDRQIDRLFQRFGTEKNFHTREALQQKIAERLVLTQPMAFTVYPYQRMLVQPLIHGIEIGGTGIVERHLWQMAPPGGQQ